MCATARICQGGHRHDGSNAWDQREISGDNARAITIGIDEPTAQTWAGPITSLRGDGIALPNMVTRSSDADATENDIRGFSAYNGAIRLVLSTQHL